MDCYNCRQSAAAPLPPRDEIVGTSHWRVSHAFDTALPGWLVIATTEHVTALDELPAEAHGELGTLLGSLSAALRTVVGCAKTYVMQFSEQTGYEHLHVHLVPRMADQPRELTGPRVFGYLGVGDTARVSDTEMDELAVRLRAALR